MAYNGVNEGGYVVDWRSYSDVSLSTWIAELSAAGSPGSLMQLDAYEAAQPYPSLCLAMLKEESSYATRFRRNIPSNHNPLNLRPPNGNGYSHFLSWVDGIRAWRERLTDANYKAGIYTRTRDLADLIHVYAPSSDDNDEKAYVAGIEASFARWGVTPMEVTPSVAGLVFGNVPYPEVIESHLPASNPYVAEGGAPDIPDAIFWHRMIGTWNGTNNWFHQGKAATAYGVAVAATDGPSLAGKIYEWIAPGNGWYGESSGPAKNPYGDGLKFVNEVGAHNVNRRSKAIEISGDAGTPLDQKSRDSIVAMTAYWADQKKIPWTQFPLLPNGRSFVIWHNEVTGLAYKTCPGWVVMDETDDLIESVRAVLKLHQGTGDVVVPPPVIITKPRTITWEPGDVGIKDYHGTPVLAMRIEVVAPAGTQPRMAASAKSKGYGAVIPPMGKAIIVGTTDSGWGFAEMPDGSYPRISLRRVKPTLPRPKNVPS